jgi:hypothetical protein
MHKSSGHQSNEWARPTQKSELPQRAGVGLWGLRVALRQTRGGLPTSPNAVRRRLLQCAARGRKS